MLWLSGDSLFLKAMTSVCCLGFWVAWQWKYKAQSSTSPDKIIIIYRQHCSLLCLRSHILLSHWCHILPCMVLWGREEKGCFSYPEKSKRSFNYITSHTIRKAFLPSPSSRMQKIFLSRRWRLAPLELRSAEARCLCWVAGHALGTRVPALMPGAAQPWALGQTARPRWDGSHPPCQLFPSLLLLWLEWTYFIASDHPVPHRAFITRVSSAFPICCLISLC